MLLNLRQYFVKEHVAFIKLTDAYDIFDPETGTQVGVAREEPPGWAKYARLLINKALLPTTVNIYEGNGEDGLPPVFSLRKVFSFLRAKVVVLNGQGQPLGRFDSKFFSFGGGFYIVNDREEQVAEVKGDWKGWNFKILDASQNEIGLITKKWAGLGKELFTSADNYIISLSESAPSGPEIAALMLAAGLAIDIVFKEAKG